MKAKVLKAIFKTAFFIQYNRCALITRCFVFPCLTYNIAVMWSNQLPAKIKSQQAANLTKDLVIISLVEGGTLISTTSKLAPSKQNAKNLKCNKIKMPRWRWPPIFNQWPSWIRAKFRSFTKTSAEHKRTKLWRCVSQVWLVIGWGRLYCRSGRLCDGSGRLYYLTVQEGICYLQRGRCYRCFWM